MQSHLRHLAIFISCFFHLASFIVPFTSIRPISCHCFVQSIIDEFSCFMYSEFRIALQMQRDLQTIILNLPNSFKFIQCVISALLHFFPLFSNSLPLSLSFPFAHLPHYVKFFFDSHFQNCQLVLCQKYFLL